MFVVSINFKTASEDLRGRLSLSDEDALDYMKRLRQDGVKECVYLSTCNRLEVYGVGEYQKATRLLARYTDTNVSELRDYLLVFQGEDALRHLFRVTSGLESMVIGEDEILGQVKRAYFQAQSAGCLGEEFHPIFQAALGAAKRVKTETLLSKTSVSVATIGAAYCHKFFEGPKKVLMIGAGGEIGKKMGMDLLSYGDCEITATIHRTHMSDPRIRAIPYESRYQAVDEADIIISATRSPHYTLTAAHLKELTPRRRLFVDLAVPRDLDEEIARLPGVSMISIDDFQKLAKENNQVKMTQMAVAEEIIDEAMDDLVKENLFRKFMPRMEGLTSRHTGGIAHFIFEYKKEASARELQTFINVLERMGR